MEHMMENVAISTELGDASLWNEEESEQEPDNVINLPDTVTINIGTGGAEAESEEDLESDEEEDTSKERSLNPSNNNTAYKPVGSTRVSSAHGKAVPPTSQSTSLQEAKTQEATADPTQIEAARKNIITQLEAAQQHSVGFFQSSAKRIAHINALREHRYKVVKGLAELYALSRDEHQTLIARLQDDADEDHFSYYYRAWCYQVLLRRFDTLCQEDMATYEEKYRVTQKQLNKLEIRETQYQKKRWQVVFGAASGVLETASTLVAAVASEDVTTRVVVGGVLSLLSIGLTSGLSYWGYRTTERDRKQHRTFNKRTSEEERLKAANEDAQKDQWVEKATELFKSQLVNSRAKCEQLRSQLIALQNNTIAYERERVNALQTKLETLQAHLNNTLVKLGVSEKEVVLLTTQLTQMSTQLTRELEQKEADTDKALAQLEEEQKAMAAENQSLKMENRVAAEKAALALAQLEKDVENLEKQCQTEKDRYEALTLGITTLAESGQKQMTRFQALVDRLRTRQIAYQQLLQSNSDKDSEVDEKEDEDSEEEKNEQEEDVEKRLSNVVPVTSRSLQDDQGKVESKEESGVDCLKPWKNQQQATLQILDRLALALDSGLIDEKTLEKRVDKQLDQVIASGDLAQLDPLLTDPVLKKRLLKKMNTQEWKTDYLYGDKSLKDVLEVTFSTDSDDVRAESISVKRELDVYETVVTDMKRWFEDVEKQRRRVAEEYPESLDHETFVKEIRSLVHKVQKNVRQLKEAEKLVVLMNKFYSSKKKRIRRERDNVAYGKGGTIKLQGAVSKGMEIKSDNVSNKNEVEVEVELNSSEIEARTNSDLFKHLPRFFEECIEFYEVTEGLIKKEADTVNKKRETAWNDLMATLDEDKKVIGLEFDAICFKVIAKTRSEWRMGFVDPFGEFLTEMDRFRKEVLVNSRPRDKSVQGRLKTLQTFIKQHTNNPQEKQSTQPSISLKK